MEVPSLLELCDGFVVTKRKGKGMQGRIFTTWMLVAAAACSTGQDESTFEDVDQPIGSGALCDWPQAFGTQDHAGMACPGLQGMEVMQAITTDEDADAENAASGFLQVHEAPPLTSGDYVVVGHKSGFKTRSNRTTERYSVHMHKWSPSVTAPNATLSDLPNWSVDTDWRPVDAEVASLGYVTNGYVQLFGPAIANGSVYVPARFGRIKRVDLRTGAVLSVINPFFGTPFDADQRVVVNSAVSAAKDGTVYYTVVAWPIGNPTVSTLPRGSWLVALSQDNKARLVDWATIASQNIGVPGTFDLCEYPFGTSGTPQATGPDSRAPQFACGTQRPALNAPIAIGSDGHLVAYSYANNAQGAGFLIEIDPATLAPIRASDTRGHLLHGCGVRLGITTFPGCAVITMNGVANIGNDPNFNGPVRFRGPDLMDGAPVILPNGDRSITGYDGGFQFGGQYDARGAGVTFRADGSFAHVNQDYGWEVTASAWRHDGTFSTLQDRQLFEPEFDLTIGQYASNGILEMTHEAQLDIDNANAIDYLDAHIVFDANGDRYGLNADGHLYRWSATSKLPIDSVELTNEDGSVRSMDGLSSYFARDQASRIYVAYAGRVYVIGSSGVLRTEAAARKPTLAATRTRLRTSAAAKRSTAAATPIPVPVEVGTVALQPTSLPESISDVKPHAGCGSLCFGDSTCNVGFPDSSLCFRCVFNFCGGFRP